MTLSPLRQMLQRFALLAVSVFVFLGPFLGPAPASAENNTSALTVPQLEQLVAPIALYPDALLSQVLMASTYPLEVVEAARWSRDNPNVAGPALEDAMQQQKWDPSVKALTSVPQTLEMMNDKLSWTQQLGDAFLGQQEDVLFAVQRLRARADANGYLKSNDKQKVTKVAAAPAGGATAPAPSGGGPAPAPVYTIEPVAPGEYAVPVYDPGVVYGSWPYPEYAPFYWTPPAYAGYGAFGYAAAALTGAAIWGGVDWGRNNVSVNVNNYNRFNRTNIANGNWVHNPGHRGAVPYRDSATTQRFGDPSKAAARDAFRNKADAGRRDMTGQNNARQNAGAAKSAGTANRGAGSKQTGQGRATGTKQAGTKQVGTKQAKTNQVGSKKSARSSQGAPKQASQARTATKKTNVARASRPAAMRGGGGSRGGGRRR